MSVHSCRNTRDGAEFSRRAVPQYTILVVSGSPSESDSRGEEWQLAAWERGRAAWPGVELPRDAFAAHLRKVGGPAADGRAGQAADTPTPDEHVADLYLACACGRGNPAAIHALERDHIRHVPRFIGKISSDPVFADDVLQAVRSKLLVGDGAPPKILEYAGRGSLGAWLRITAIRTAQTMIRRARPERRRVEPDAIADVIGDSTDGELQVLRAKLGGRVTQVFQEALRDLTPEQRNLLRLHYADGLSFERMGALFRVNRATACRWVADARRTIVDRTRGRLREELGLRESELDAVTRLLRSQLDVSMTSLFANR